MTGHDNMCQLSHVKSPFQFSDVNCYMPEKAVVSVLWVRREW